MIDVNIIRQNLGRSSTRHGILLAPLKPKFKNVLLQNKYLKHLSHSDDIMYCIFAIESSRASKKAELRVYINPNTHRIATTKEIKEEWMIVEWKCAYCNKPICSKIGEIDKQNLTCNKCYDYYLRGSSRDDRKMIDAAVEFTDYCRDLIMEQQKRVLKTIKKNAKS